MSIPKLIIFTLILCVTSTVQSADFSYSSIEKRYSSVALSESKKQLSEMQGECLIGLKNLNFRKKKSFDAVAECCCTVHQSSSPKKVAISASGFQLMLFIPIAINSRHERAYSAIEAQAGDGLISDVQVKESWSYAFVGTVYKTTIEANIYPRK